MVGLQDSLLVAEIAIWVFAIDALVRAFSGKGFLMKGVEGDEGNGGGGLGRLFQGGRGESGSAAVAAANDQAALAEESAEAKERAAEIAEEARELNDLRAIRAITKIERKTWDGIKGVLKTLIDKLRSRVKAGSANPEFYNEVIAKVSEIVQYSNKLQQEDQALDARIRELDALETAEKANISKSFLGTKKEIQEMIRASKAAGWNGKGPNNAAWTTIKGKFETDAEKRIADQISTVRSTMVAHRRALANAERTFTAYFTQAEAFLRANDIPRAILQLENAGKDIDTIQKLLKDIGQNDVARVQGFINRRMGDLKRETKASTFTQVRLLQQGAAIKKQGRLQRMAKGIPFRGVITGLGRKRI